MHHIYMIELTEFLPKRGVLSLTPMDQGWVHNPNVTPIITQQNSELCLALVAAVMHTTQQNFLIGLFAKMDTFHWLRHIL